MGVPARIGPHDLHVVRKVEITVFGIDREHLFAVERRRVGERITGGVAVDRGGDVVHRKFKIATRVIFVPETKFGLNRFVNGYLDLISLWFLSKFGVQPMHIFGFLGSLMFIFGFIAVAGVGIHKLYAMHTLI